MGKRKGEEAATSAGKRSRQGERTPAANSELDDVRRITKSCPPRMHTLNGAACHLCQANDTHRVPLSLELVRRARDHLLERLRAALRAESQLPRLTLQRLLASLPVGDSVASHTMRGAASWHASAVAREDWRRLDGGGRGVRAWTDTHANEQLEALGAQRLPGGLGAWMACTLQGALDHLLNEQVHVRELRRTGVVTFHAFLPEWPQYFRQVPQGCGALTLPEDAQTHTASGAAHPGVLLVRVPVDPAAPVELEVLPLGLPMAEAEVRSTAAVTTTVDKATVPKNAGRLPSAPSLLASCCCSKPLRPRYRKTLLAAGSTPL